MPCAGRVRRTLGRVFGAGVRETRQVMGRTAARDVQLRVGAPAQAQDGATVGLGEQPLRLGGVGLQPGGAVLAEARQTNGVEAHGGSGGLGALHSSAPRARKLAPKRAESVRLRGIFEEKKPAQPGESVFGQQGARRRKPGGDCAARRTGDMAQEARRGCAPQSSGSSESPQGLSAQAHRLPPDTRPCLDLNEHMGLMWWLNPT